MNATKIAKLVSELKDEIYSKLYHRTLLEYTGLPPVWEDQLFYLLLPQFNGEQWTEHHQTAASSVGMIQAALTTHDHVREHHATTKSQQLTVLAGDYYSGMYYATLANLPDIQLVRALSTAVADISERKTELYEPYDKTFSKWIEQFEIIISKVVEQFLHHYKFGAYIPLMKKGMLISRLCEELKQLEKGVSLVRFEEILANDKMDNDEVSKKINVTLQRLVVEYIGDIRSSSLLTNDMKTLLLSRVETLKSEQHMTREG